MEGDVLMRRTFLTLAATTCAVAGVALFPSVASATPPIVTSGTVTATNVFGCSGFSILFDEHNDWTERDFYDQDGAFVRAITHVTATDTDTNLSTGKSIDVRSRYTVTDYADGSETISGLFWIANDPGRGHVIQDVGRIFYGADGSVVLKGPHEVISASDDVFVFCSAVTSP
jgi:hypothetical protein